MTSNISSQTPTISLCEKSQETVRIISISSVCTALRQFFIEPAYELTKDQNILLRRRILEQIARRGIYWICMLLISNFLVITFAEIPKNPPHGFSSIMWTLGLWFLVLPYIYLLYRIINLPKNITSSHLNIEHFYFCLWLTITSVLWLSGNWILKPQPPFDQTSFYFAQEIFLWFTLLGHVITLILFSPSRAAIFSTLICGFFLPFFLFIINSMQAPHQAIPWYCSQLVIYCLIGLFLSIDQRRIQSRGILLEAERARAEAERSRANNFVAAISHDLRQPLTTIALKLVSLKSKVPLPEVLNYVHDLQQQTIALQSMIEGTLDLSSLEAGTWRVSVREVAIPNLLGKIVNDVRTYIEADGINLEIELYSLPYVVKTDPKALERILRNLLSNAIRYTPSNNKGKIILKCEVIDTFIEISVIDNGIGIPSNKLDDIFNEYIQLDNPERDRNKGLGLGLSIVKGLASLLSHQLKVESKEGKGSKFSVLVPIVGRIPLELLENTNEIGDPEDLTDMVVVIVEDDEGPREALRERLIEWGCYVIDGESAKDVIRKLENEETPCELNFIISDYRLRDNKNGIEAIIEIRSRTSASIPGAIWTAETDPMVLREISNNGLKRFSKPPDEHKLFELLLKFKPKIQNEV